MKNYEIYRKEYETAQKYYETHIADKENKAFEYGTLVVKNAILVSGGGLLAIPAIAGLSTDLPVDTAEAATAGFSFACALVLAIAGAYVIHINWTLNAAAWEKYWDDRREYLHKFYEDGTDPEQLGKIPQVVYFKRAILATFWLPHLLAAFYLILLGYGFLRLYSALGVTT